jgi:hypothetical protein
MLRPVKPPLLLLGVAAVRGQAPAAIVLDPVRWRTRTVERHIFGDGAGS